MLYVDTLLGVNNYPEELKNLILKFFCLELIITVIYLSHTWISLYYISILGSYAIFGSIVAIGTVFSIVLDLPLGVLTDRFGQRGAFCSALGCLTIYYLGLIFATNSLQLLCLEILVGIFSALLSGSYMAWFLNSWGFLVEKTEKNDNLFRNTMGNVRFVKMISVSSVTIIGGFLLFQAHLPPQLIFFFQGIIAALGLIFGFAIMVNSNPQRYQQDRSIITNTKTISSFSLRNLSESLHRKYFEISPFFLSFGLLNFTSLSFSTVIFPLLVYYLMSSETVLNGSYFRIDFTSAAILILSLVNSITDFAYGVSSKFSGRFTSFIKSPRKGLVVFYTLNFPFAWISFLFILLLKINSSWKIIIIISLFLIRLIVSGLTSSLYWQLYYDITTSKYRSSQESYQNTITLIIYTLGFSILGQIMEVTGLLESLLFLFSLALIGILILLKAKEPVGKKSFGVSVSMQ